MRFPRVVQLEKRGLVNLEVDKVVTAVLESTDRGKSDVTLNISAALLPQQRGTEIECVSTECLAGNSTPIAAAYCRMKSEDLQRTATKYVFRTCARLIGDIRHLPIC